mmetsp:Transcript_105299/g.302786  ORF Transcript_105299/g.302786 Transcript_105299/m.302786 type:complete len:263 (+) Transcript_105299:1440-2228(+)
MCTPSLQRLFLEGCQLSRACSLGAHVGRTVCGHAQEQRRAATVECLYQEHRDHWPGSQRQVGPSLWRWGGWRRLLLRRGQRAHDGKRDLGLHRLEFARTGAWYRCGLLTDGQQDRGYRGGCSRRCGLRRFGRDQRRGHRPPRPPSGRQCGCLGPRGVGRREGHRGFGPGAGRSADALAGFRRGRPGDVPRRAADRRRLGGHCLWRPGADRPLAGHDAGGGRRFHPSGHRAGRRLFRGLGHQLPQPRLPCSLCVRPRPHIHYR